MFSIKSSGLKRLESDLKVFGERAFPFATKNTVNQSALKARQIAQDHIKSEMVLRNRFTARSVQVEQTRTLQVSQQAAVVGSIADYMEDQEFGAVKGKEGKEGTPIATSYSAGQGDGAQPRTRLPRKPNKLQNITLKHRRSEGKGRRQKNLIAVKAAAATGRKYLYLDLSRRKGIFKVVGGKRRPRVKMLWDLTNQSVVIRRRPWLAPSVEETKKHIPKIYEDSLKFQLKRLGLFAD